MHSSRKNNVILAIVILFLAFVVDSTISYAEEIKRVDAVVENFFIKKGSTEHYAEHKLLTIADQQYVPLDDLSEVFNLDVEITSTEIHIDSQMADDDLRQSSKLLSRTLPKETVNPLNNRIQFHANVEAGGSILIEDKPENIVFQKNGHNHFYPASTVKIMTALLALENTDLGERVTVSSEAKNIPHDSSRAHIRPGDSMTMKQLLYGMMIPSGNDAAVAVAAHIAGTEAEFVKLMNQRAKELGAKQTNFVNSHGYHDPNQYITPHDLVKITSEALNHPFFLDLISTPYFQGNYKNNVGQPVTRNWNATNQQIRKNSPHFSDVIVGGKTGYTSASRHNLVSVAEAKEGYFISVMLKGARDQRYIDTERIVKRAIQERSEYDKAHKQQITIREERLPIFLNGKLLKLLNGLIDYEGIKYVPVELTALLSNNGNTFITNNQQYKVSLDNQLFVTNIEPIMKEGRLLLPVRALFNQFGLSLNYEPKSRVVTGKNSDTTISIPINSKIVMVDGKETILDSPAIIEEGNTFVPVRFISEQFNTKVDWGRGRTLVFSSS
ncbi:stalk domain-containing protein [Bacillus sp. FJAT-45350]|uniref:stalk domain-containing protein n=1 Tax=Bacillus sp. FJAT-45350 TaxID=2011014 RepID=UPI000BB70DE6|nr:stalk domain-containing protein [Bacillus sp. FJAT-45350]